jgi:hypothetical protein
LVQEPLLVRAYLFVFALLVVAATAVFFVAGLVSASWARDLCAVSFELCQRPRWLAIAVAMAGLVLVLLKLTEI